MTLGGALTRITTLEARNAEHLSVIPQLQARISEIEEHLAKNPKTLSRPRKRGRPKKRKRGGQTGHEGRNRAILPVGQVDRPPTGKVRVLREALVGR